MMTLKEARAILNKIEVPEGMLEKAKQKMLDMIHESKKSGLYAKQGGVFVEFCDKHAAWITVWTFEGYQYYNLTERGENIYTGSSAEKCAEWLYKLGIAHKQYGEQFLDCGR